MSARIIYFVPRQGLTEKMKGLVAKYLRACGLNTSDIFYINAHDKLEDTYVYKGPQRGWLPVAAKFPLVLENMRRSIKSFRPKVVICNDHACIAALGGRNLNLYRAEGMVYKLDNVPVIGINNWNFIHSDKTASMRMQSALRKVYRYANDNQAKEPKFNYTVCRTIEQVREATAWLLGADVISCDIETASKLISCVGFAALRGTEIRCFVVPFLCYSKPENAFWEREADEVCAWDCIREVMDSSVYKVFQNGAYDCSYFIRYRINVRNYLFDTLHMFHSIWCEVEKKLNVIASLMMDSVKFWKDDKKADEEDAYKQNPEWWEQFWRYNAYDCYVTLLSLRQLLRITNSQSWVSKNYNNEIHLQLGPALAGSLRGLLCDDTRRKAKVKFLTKKSSEALVKLRILADEPNFNPNSSDQVCQLIYGVFGAPARQQRTRGGMVPVKTADQQYLKELTTYHPIYKYVIDAIWAVKKPANDVSKYGTYKLLSWGNRFRYGLHAGGTETGRFSGSKSAFWLGTNPQNVKPVIRELFVADPGYVFFEPDFSQSDAWFVANESGEPALLRTLHSGKDTHAIHAAHFFRTTYEQVVEGVKCKDPFYADNTTGIRAVTKRVVHGSNYRMMARTLYNTMGREAVIAAARALGATNVYQLSNSDLIDVCAKLLEEYHVMYPGLRPWFDAIIAACIKAGNLATCYGGRTRLFLGDPASDQGIQRELSAYYGQGGTAGNINRVLLEIYYRHPDWEISGDCYFMTQTHDSMLYMIRKEKLHEYASKILEIMRREIMVKGRSFSVPVDAKVGLSWGNSDSKGDDAALVSYKDTVTYDELERRNNLVQQRYRELLASLQEVSTAEQGVINPDNLAEYYSNLEMPVGDVDEEELVA